MNLEYVNKTQKEVWTLQRMLSAFNTLRTSGQSWVSKEDTLVLENLIKDKERTIRLEYMQD